MRNKSHCVGLLIQVEKVAAENIVFVSYTQYKSENEQPNV